jgi:hypothetical protein
MGFLIRSLVDQGYILKKWIYVIWACFNAIVGAINIQDKLQLVVNCKPRLIM